MSDSFPIPWTITCQAPLLMGFSRQEYWSGLPFPSPGDLPDPGIEPVSPGLQADSLPTELRGKPYMGRRGNKDTSKDAIVLIQGTHDSGLESARSRNRDMF